MKDSNSVFTVSGDQYELNFFNPSSNEVEHSTNEGIENQEQSDSESEEEEKDVTFSHVLYGFFNDISIEPVLFLRFVGQQVYKVVQQQFKLERFCFLDLDYTDEECLEMNDGNVNHTDVLNDAQDLENAFGVYEMIASTILPLIIILFAGSWSDSNGRKIPICINLAGFALYMGVYVLEAIYTSWSAKVLLIGEFLKGIGGGDMMFIMVYTSFLSDRTSTRDRLYRIGISMAVAHLGLPVGTLLGAWIYDKAGYIWVFATSCALNTTAALYMAFNVKDANNSINSTGKTRLIDIFNIRHPINTFKFAIAPKPNRGRSHLFTLIIAMLIYMGSTQINVYLWTMKLFNWSVKQFSQYQTFNQTYSQLMGLLLSPLVGFFGIKDCDVAIGIASLMMASNIWEGTLTKQDQGWAVYAATIVAFAVLYPSSAIRSMISKVAQEDTGKAFSFLAMLEVIWELILKIIYTAVYDATLETYPSAQSFVEAGFSFLVIILLVGLRISMSQIEKNKKI